MIIRNKTAGSRAARYYGSANSELSRTLEKLASGYKINRAGDDAAGLAVSEKMRAQITGMSRAKLNSLEGCRLIQIGEGALEEVHTMLNRASYLAAQSSNGVYNDEVDRENLQKELEKLCQEIDRIAKTTNFNNVQLFQDDGIEYERTIVNPAAVSAQQQIGQPQNSGQGKAATSQGALESGTKQVVKIEYFEHDAVATDQTPGGSSTLASDITLQENGVSKKLSDILKDEIIPNTVNNILNTYGAAFSYLSGSKIGIGLEYFSQGSSDGATTLAYVQGQIGSSGSVSSSSGQLVSREDYITYTLGVNVAAIDPNSWETKDRAELEATIAHEMIHAFMDEAATSGMFGKIATNDGNLTQQVDKFPSWFIEGMAQTASGPGNWLKSTGGLNIDVSSDEAAIKNAIASNQLGVDGNANNYGTGYLACMYLGAVIGGYNGTDANPQSLAATISGGLSRLLAAIIHDGKSLDTAIQDLTSGKFSSTSNFVSNFNSGAADGMTAFIQNLLSTTGSGRGGVVSGDLSAADLTINNPGSNSLFQLETNSSEVKNVYPDGYNVYSGGAAGVSGTPPTDNTPPVPPYIDFGNIRIYGAQDSDLSYDSTNGTLTVKAGSGIKITMRPSDAVPDPNNTHDGETVHNITLDSGVSDATLSGVTLSGGDLTVQGAAEITYESDNSFGKIKLEGDAVFHGTGGLKTVDFDAGSHDVKFNGGAVIVNNGTGAIANPGAVTVEGAAIAATPTITDSTGKAAIDIPWTPELSGMGNITSIQIDGQGYDMSLDSNQAAKLWLDPGKSHRITFTDENGVSKTLTANQVYETDGVTFKEFAWGAPARPFTVTGTRADGTAIQEGVDWEYTGDDGNTLLIKSGADITITAGDDVDENGNKLTGRIQVEDGIGNVNLTLGDAGNINSGVSVVVSNGRAFDLGENNNVTLNLADGITNTFQSGNGYAGISVGSGTDLTITGSDGVLKATGGSNSAGIGRDGTGASDQTSSITITGGDITAVGGSNGAGIGAGNGKAFGDITITGGTIHSTGGVGGAGIGGAYFAPVGDISITDAEVIAKSNGHGAGIGGGWYPAATNGNITIDGASVITASSLEHGTGIGAGCQGASGAITIKGQTVIHLAEGGNDGAGIGASWHGSCGDIVIEEDAQIELAKGGNNGAGIGAGSSSSTVSGTITIDTTGKVTAEGGSNGVGIGSGYQNSSCGDIEILQGTVTAKGSTDSTGIGAGRDSTSGNISIGDPTGNKKVVVSADGGMSNDGGNIISYSDRNHTIPGKVTITGNNTSVYPGEAGEGKYSTSGVPVDPAVDPADIEGLPDNEKLFSYPVYLFETDPPPAVGETSSGTTAFPLPLPADATNIQISAAPVSDPAKIKTWAAGLSHDPIDPNFAYIWMTGEDQTLTITYDSASGGAGQSVTLDLKFFSDAGVFRTADQPEPPPAEEPDYVVKPTPPVDPVIPTPPVEPITPAPTPKPPSIPAPPKGQGGIILQIGANSGEILEIPRFYLSVRALGLDHVNISTQDQALASMPILKNAINRVSSIRGDYGALQNRLDHNQNELSVGVENLTDAESRIRDADMAEEYTKFIALSILQQSAQAMMAHCNQDANRVLQLFQ